MSRFEVEGVEEVLRMIAEVPTAADAHATRVFSEGGDVMLRELDVTTPVRTGYLRSRNQTRLSGTLRGGSLVLEVFNDASYALFVEMGIRGRRARHFLANAFEGGRAWIALRLRP